MSRITILRLHNAHRDWSKPSSPTMTKQFNVADGFVLERQVDGSFRISHPKATKVLGVGSSEVLDWDEDVFMPGIAKVDEKRSREKVA